MPNINYLIAKGLSPDEPRFDLMQGYGNALRFQAMQREAQAYPEEMNWLRQARGLTLEKAGWEREDRMRELSRRPFKDGKEALEVFRDALPMLNLGNWKQSREWFVRHGMPAAPMPENFASESEFQSWKQAQLPKLNNAIQKVEVYRPETPRSALDRMATMPGPAETVVGPPEKEKEGRFQDRGTTEKGYPVFFDPREGKRYAEVGGVLEPWDLKKHGKIEPTAIGPPSNIFIGGTPEGGIVTIPTKGTPTPQITPGPAGGLTPKQLSEDFKKDVSALGQAEDLVNQLEEQWISLGITDRTSAVSAFMAGKLGKNPSAKVYADTYEAFLGQLSRSIAAERGVLTNQDIDRIRGAIARIGMNPLSVDSGEEGKRKWKQAHQVIENARKRAQQRSGMTQANPLGSTPKEQPAAQRPRFKILKVE